jgi:hypothetical protein
VFFMLSYAFLLPLIAVRAIGLNLLVGVMWWQMYFAAILTKYVVVMYLRRNYIRNGVESRVESGVECSETNVRKLRFGINFRDACISRRKEVEIWDQLSFF